MSCSCTREREGESCGILAAENAPMNGTGCKRGSNAASKHDPLAGHRYNHTRPPTHHRYNHTRPSFFHRYHHTHPPLFSSFPIFSHPLVSRYLHAHHAAFTPSFCGWRNCRRHFFSSFFLSLSFSSSRFCFRLPSPYPYPPHSPHSQFHIKQPVPDRFFLQRRRA